MKKEIFAALLLLILILFSFFNCAYVDTGAELICCHARNAGFYAQSGDLSGAERELNISRQMFSKKEGHAAIFLRRDDVSEISDIFYDAQQALAEKNLSALSVLCDKLIFKLGAIADSQKIRIYNIL